MLRPQGNSNNRTGFTVKVDAHKRNRYGRCTLTDMQKSMALIVVAFVVIFVIMSSHATSIGKFTALPRSRSLCLSRSFV